MTWQKMDLIYGPDGTLPWARHSALQPTPLVREDRVRVFCGHRDNDGRSSVGWVDLDRADPTMVRARSTEPALARGEEGSWDHDGVVPAAIVERGEELWLYYAGYERVDDPLIRFKVFSGLAVSTDGGSSFDRMGDHGGQVLFPCDEAPLFRVIHSILPVEGGWKAWYGGGGEFRQGEAKTLPVYDIRTMVSIDGVAFPTEGEVVLKQDDAEFRVGRPFVVPGPQRWDMFFGASSEAEPYRLGYASSVDGGSTWQRDDSELGSLPHPGTWDSDMSAYPAVYVLPDGRRAMLFNGNEYGRAGFGLALDSDES